jgi:hypothetical protein
LADARTGKRFPLNLPIHIKKGKAAKGAKATTQNVSAAGIFIEADESLEIGSTIEFDIVLPAKIVGADRDVEISCKGRVVRRDGKGPKAKGKGGIGCVIDTYKFVRKK